MKDIKRIISYVLGLEFIENVAAKKISRIAAAGLVVIAGKSKVVSAIFVAAGITDANAEAAILVAILAGIEALRGWAKHSDKPAGVSADNVPPVPPQP